MKINEKFLAIKLRQQGFPYSHIRAKVTVSKSTLSMWLRDVELSDFQKKKILHGREISRDAAAQKRKQQRIQKISDLAVQGKKEFPGLTQNGLFLPGLALYWAEGDKHRQEKVKFTNSDPQMISFMMRWFREICNVPEKKFRVALHVHTLHITKNVEGYWAKITRLPIAQFQKTYVKQTTLGQRRNILYNGTCAVIVHDKELFRRMNGWREAFLEHFEIRPRSSMDRTRDF